MKKKITLALLIVAFAAVAVVFISNKFIKKSSDKSVESSVVVLQSNSEAAQNNSEVSMEEEDSGLVSLVQLRPDETLISIVSMDFDGDGFDDQINAVKTLSSPNIFLLVGLYNQKKSVYERKGLLETGISQSQTFSYTGMDLTGEHRTALVFQGFADNGDSILQAFFISNRNDRFSIRSIADLRGDGTIFIQQVDRYDAYERSNANGASFPIWVYTSDSENPNSNDQLQVQYEWSDAERRYVQTKSIRVRGSRIAAKELARIQDGTVATFAGFLNGLWYMNDSTGGTRYLFFDYNAGEIIFLKDDTEEVYKWAHSNIRRNGIYLSTTNQEIENLKRRIDISLKSTDEVHVRLQDDVRMIISESTMWDGDYKKTNQTAYIKQIKGLEKVEDFSAEFEKVHAWKTSDGNTIKFLNGKYILSGEASFEEGMYTCTTIGGQRFMQFRPLSEKTHKFLYNFYRVEEEGDARDNMVTLVPCKIQADGISDIEQKTVVLVRIPDSQ